MAQRQYTPKRELSLENDIISMGLANWVIFMPCYLSNKHFYNEKSIVPFLYIPEDCV